MPLQDLPLSWWETLCLRFYALTLEQLASNIWSMPGCKVLAPLSSSRAGLTGHFCSRWMQRWKQPMPLCQLWKINFSLHLGAVSCTDGRVDSPDKLPESQVPPSETQHAIQWTPSKTFWGRKDESQLRVKGKTDTTSQLVKRAVSSGCPRLKCHCRHGSYIPLIGPGALIVSYINCPQSVIYHLY